MSVARLEISTGVALVGAGVFTIHDVYTKHAGNLHDVRTSTPNNVDAAQRLIDADFLAGGLTLLAGGTLAIATGKVYPLVLAFIAFSIVAVYYHMALVAPGGQEGNGDTHNDYDDDGE